MNVAGILKFKGSDIITAAPGQTLREIASTLATNKIGAIVVTDTNGRVAGIISERDLVRAIAESGGAVLNETADRHMTREVVTCGREDNIAELMAKMTEGRFRHLPVVEDGKLTGIISIGDVVKQRIQETESEVEAMRGYIASG